MIVGSIEQQVLDDDQVRELCAFIVENARDIGAGGTLLTKDVFADHGLFAPIVALARQLVADTWQSIDLPVTAWGIRITAGVEIPSHDHRSCKFTALYFLTAGVGLVVEGELCTAIPHKLITFAGTAKHWTAEHRGADRISIGMAFG